MTPQNFAEIAQAIRDNITSRVDREVVARALLPVLDETTPKFNQEHFVDACMGIGSYL